MLETLVDVFSTGGAGALVGGIFNWLGKREERKKERQDQQHEIAMRKADQADMRLEQKHALAMADKTMEQAELEGDIARDVREMDGWVETLKQAGKKTGIKGVDAIRGLMRPGITTYLLVLSTLVAIQLHELVNGMEALPQAELVEMYRFVINQLLFLTATAVTFWFGARPQMGVRAKNK